MQKEKYKDQFTPWRKRELLYSKNDKEQQIMKEALTEERYYAVAYCPDCNEEHDISTCSNGQKKCPCGTVFYWSTVD